MREFEKDAIVALIVRLNEAARDWSVYGRLATRIAEGRESAMNEYHAATAALKTMYQLNHEADDFVEAVEKAIGTDRFKLSVQLTRSQMQSAETILENLMDFIIESFGNEPGFAKQPPADLELSDSATNEEAKADTNIKDRVLGALQAAGPEGTTASRIRDILRAEGLEMHDKTVGMSLWRLSTEDPPKARRQGRTWFYALSDTPEMHEAPEGDPERGPTQNGVFN